MPRKADPSKKTASGIYKSRLRSNAIYTGEGNVTITNEHGETVVIDTSTTAKVESVRLRVPIGWKKQMQQYVAQSDKYKSVNSMICDLIRKELKIKD